MPWTSSTPVSAHERSRTTKASVFSVREKSKEGRTTEGADGDRHHERQAGFEGPTVPERPSSRLYFCAFDGIPSTAAASPAP